MARSGMILRVVAVVSFGVALHASQASAAASLAIAIAALAAYLAVSVDGRGPTWIEGRARSAPWILAASSAFAVGSWSIPYVITLIAGAALAGVSLVRFSAYGRLVPAMGVPLVSNIVLTQSDFSLRVLGPWLAMVVVFAVLSNHVRVSDTTEKSSGSEELVMAPARAIQFLAMVGVCALWGFLLAPMIKTPDLDQSLAPRLGDLGGLAFGTHPGLKWGQLDTGRRVDLGDEEVLRVKAERPDYWRGLTYTSWDGRTWTNPDDGDIYTWQQDGVNLSSPLPGGKTEVQRFTVMRSGMDVIHGAYKIESLISTARSGRISADGSIRLDQPLGAGARWTVFSSVREVTPALLRRSDPLTAGISRQMELQFATESDVTPAVARLAYEITKDEPTTYDKVKALEAWIDLNISYSRQIETLPDGADAVEQLLFVDKLGYCEQIGTSLVVMLRSLGVPARLVVGYVPGSYDSSTGEYVSLASDAHAWAEVYFPGVGWQGFDPTAGVPLSGDELEARAEADVAAPTTDWILIAQFAVVILAVGAIGILITAAATGSATKSEPRLDRLDGVGQNLGLNWSPAMTIGEKTEDLIRIGVSPAAARRARMKLEQATYASGPESDSPDVDQALDELCAAVDQLLKTPA